VQAIGEITRKKEQVSIEMPCMIEDVIIKVQCRTEGGQGAIKLKRDLKLAMGDAVAIKWVIAREVMAVARRELAALEAEVEEEAIKEGEPRDANP